MAKKLILYVDGACRGNPGPGSIGILIQDEASGTNLQISKYIGHTTNNQAEYSALITAITEAAKLGATQVDIRTDSELMARQIQGSYKVKSALLRPLHQKAKELLVKFHFFTITNIPREDNEVADRLANEALDHNTR